MATLAFDVYGTLIDTTGVIDKLEELIGSQANSFSALWRSKQLEYSFRRGLMQNYVDFASCTRQAFDFCCQAIGVDIVGSQRDAVLASYRSLPAFEDAATALPKLNAAGHLCYAFSNGRPDDVDDLLQKAGIRKLFVDVVSCDEVRSFKPSPAVYAHFLRRAQVDKDRAWMISGNSFDVTGAVSAGMRGVWVKRSPNALLDPWELVPDATISGLEQLLDLFAKESF